MRTVPIEKELVRRVTGFEVYAEQRSGFDLGG